VSVLLLLRIGATPVADVGEEDLEQAVVSALEDSASVSALVGTTILPNVIPQDDQLPAVTYCLMTGVEAFHLGGTSGMATARIRFRAWSRDKTESARIVEAIRSTLLPIRGRFGPTWVYYVDLAGKSQAWETADDASDEGTFRRQIDLKFKFRVSVPS
jgi:hypothetical protein